MKSINRSNVVFLLGFHIGAVVALFYFSWPAFIVALVLHVIAISFGVGVGFHRLLTHRGFKVPKFVEYVLVICGTLSLQGGPIRWVTTHRVHHANADKEGDPHSPKVSFWWAHMGWMINGSLQNHLEAVKIKYSPDLIKDKFYRWLEKWYWVSTVILFALLFIFGGWSVMLWGIFLRTIVGLHFTSLVNSAAHTWGARRFNTDDDSRNNWWVAILTFGEGWHNNHHYRPTNPRHGIVWYEGLIDTNWWTVCIMQHLGLAERLDKS